MQRFVTFVNGSTLFGAFKALEVHVNDYEAFFRYLFELTVERWRSAVDAEVPPPAQHVRVYWYVVDLMDEWDLHNPKTRQHLQDRFQDDRELKGRWLEEAERLLAGTGAPRAKIEQTAFALCFDDVKGWYEKRRNILDGMNRFHHAMEASSDFIDIRRAGRWKVDILRKSYIEKGTDAAMAADIVGLRETYDVATLVGADSDGVPGLEYVKCRGRQVAVAELMRGAPPVEGRVRQFITQLKFAADFLVPVFEDELLRLGIAVRGNGERMGLRES